MSHIQHFDFISLSPKVKNIKDVVKQIGEAIEYQNIFTKRTTPYEMIDNYSGKRIIYIEKIDRLYYINYIKHLKGEKFEMICRIDNSDCGGGGGDDDDDDDDDGDDDNDNDISKIR